MPFRIDSLKLSKGCPTGRLLQVRLLSFHLSSLESIQSCHRGRLLQDWESPNPPKSAGESAGKSAGKKSTAGGIAVRSEKTDPVQFKRGFKKGLLRDKFVYDFEAIISLKSHMPERRKAACKTPVFTSTKAPFLQPLGGF